MVPPRQLRLNCRLNAAVALLAVFAVEHVADDAAALGVDFALVAAGDSIFGSVFRVRPVGRAAFGFAAAWAAVGEAGLVGLQLEFFSANDAGLNGEYRHNEIMLAKGGDAGRVVSHSERGFLVGQKSPAEFVGE